MFDSYRIHTLYLLAAAFHIFMADYFQPITFQVFTKLILITINLSKQRFPAHINYIW